MRGAEQTGMFGMGAVEPAFAMAKQFRLQQLGRYRGAIDRDEWLVLARARIVQGARQNFLAGTAGTGDQYGRIGPRDAMRVLEHRMHPRAACDDAMRPTRRRLADAVAVTTDAVDRPLTIDRLGHKIDGTGKIGRAHV